MTRTAIPALALWKKLSELIGKAKKLILFAKSLEIPQKSRYDVVENDTGNKEGRTIMSQKIRALHNLTPAELLQRSNQTAVFPVDIDQICNSIGILLMPFDFSRIDIQVIQNKPQLEDGNIVCAIIGKDNDLAILYQKDDLISNRRFMIAHELGHICRHLEADSVYHVEFRTALLSGSEMECAANAFARQLLIPSDILSGMLGDRQQVSPKMVSQLSSLFIVPSSVIQERLGDFDIIVEEPLFEGDSSASTLSGALQEDGRNNT